MAAVRITMMTKLLRMSPTIPIENTMTPLDMYVFLILEMPHLHMFVIDNFLSHLRRINQSTIPQKNRGFSNRIHYSPTKNVTFHKLLRFRTSSLSSLYIYVDGPLMTEIGGILLAAGALLTLIGMTLFFEGNLLRIGNV